MTAGGYVYADLTFLVNVIMDFVILWATAKLTGLTFNYGRLVTAAILGGVYALGCLFPDLEVWYRLPVKALFSLLLVVFAYCPASWKQFWTAVVCFYGVSFAVGGAVIGSSYFLKNNLPELRLGYLWLAVGISIAFILGKAGERYFLERLIPRVACFPVSLSFDELACKGEGFLDTGNNLTDPLTGRPVIIVEYGLLRSCLPEDVRKALDRVAEGEDYLQAMPQTGWAHRLRLIPFTSIGRKHGLLPGLRCDSVMIDTGFRSVCQRNVVVGIHWDKLSPEGKFQMLLPCEILR